MRVSWWSGAAVLGLVAAGLSGCAPTGIGPSSNGGDGGPVTLTLAGFAVPREANNAIQAAWAETPDGAGVTWVESYGASGDQSRAVAAGLDADYVHFSLEGDVTRLVDAGLVAEDWNQGPYGGTVSRSVVVIVVRPGNPLGIEGWDDLVDDGVEVITPNPGSSGSARWNVLAAWGSVIANGGTEEDAEAYVTELFAHVVSLPGSSRDATSAFLAGTGDALLSYENEAILARQHGEDLEYIVPDTTLRIDNPGAVLIDADPQARLWLDFVLSGEGQREFAAAGFRPIVDDLDVAPVAGANDPWDPFPAPAHLLAISDPMFGGWDSATARFFDADSGIITRIQVATGRAS